jgi:iron-sulfur cluster repair protein YtfE (RIC family)
MENTLELIDKTIEEHQQIMTGIQATEGLANDVAAILELDKPIETFVAGRLEDNKQHLNDLQKSLEKIDTALEHHFDGEEKAVLKAFEKGSQSLASAFSILLEEHDELRKRIKKSENIAAELSTGSISREVWEGRAYGLRTHIRHTRKLLEAHASSETELFQALRKELQKA